jgi:GNAT superfamily N-acetyltransferase
MSLFREQADVSVRPAVGGDEAAIAAIQLDAWRCAHLDVLGAEVLDRLDPVAFRERWAAAIGAPPGPGHRVLVACERATVVGFAAVRPLPAVAGQDPPGGELIALEVATGSQRGGHGSRLLTAAVDLIRADGAAYLAAWVLDGDGARAQFLRSAGLGPEDVTRVLATGPGPGQGVNEHRWSAQL